MPDRNVAGMSPDVSVIVACYSVEKYVVPIVGSLIKKRQPGYV
jgi:hypothetical protein